MRVSPLAGVLDAEKFCDLHVLVLLHPRSSSMMFLFILNA